MPNEFVHFRGYARRPTRPSPSLEEILGEARRDPAYCGHLAEPHTPVVRYGAAIETLGVELDERLHGVRDHLGRALPSTSLVLLAGVTSWPTPRAEVEQSDAARQAYEVWMQRCLTFCRQLFGEALLSVVEHIDEPYLHVHAFAAARPHPVTGVYSLETIWPPLAAEARARRANKSRKAQRAAFRKKARLVQELYYRMVGAPSGLARFGPRRQRLTREEWRAQRSQAAAMAEFARETARRAEAIDEEVRARAEARAHELIATAVADATAAANAEIADLRALRDRLVARIRSDQQRLRELWQETERLRRLLADLGVDPDKPFGFAPG
jgi:hypothetical protein